MSTIPADIDVNIIPGVIGAGGNTLATIGLVLDDSTRVPISPLGVPLSFPNLVSVQNYFGPTSKQAAFATQYFLGFTGRTAIPSALLFTQYPSQAVAAYLRGGTFALTLAQMQALTGSLTVVMDGYSHVIASISLAAYNSFTAAATAIAAAFTDPTEASFTASIGSSSTTCTSSGTTLTLGALASGYLSPGDLVSGTDSTNSLPAGCFIVKQLTGTAGGGAAATFQLSAAATPGNLTSCTVTGTSTVLDVTIDTDHAISAGQTLSGSTVAAGTIITAQISGTPGGVGLYQLSGLPVHIASEAMTGVATAPLVTYDTVSSSFVITSGITGAPSTAAFATGTLSGPLLFTAATGAVLSQGAAATNSTTFMTALTNQNRNWVSFTTDFDPDAAFFVGSISTTTLTVTTLTSGAIAIGDTLSGPNVAAGTTITAGSGLSWTVSVSQTAASSNMEATASGGGHGNTQKLAFAAWNNSVPDTYLYAMWDTDISPTIASPATGSAGYIVNNLGYEGTAPIYEPTDLGHAAVLMGWIASLNFNAINGRKNFKFLQQAGLVPSVTTSQVATNLGSGSSNGPNGYNCVGAVATAEQGFIYWRNGQVSGKFLWIDSYVNQIWLNNLFQQAALQFLLNIGSFPYNTAGYNQFYTAMTGGSTLPIVQPPASPVAQALNFGAIRPNVPLSASQAVEVNNAAGVAIDGILSTRGWYFQILPPTAQVRAARGTPVINFWYTDGQSVNQITMNSVAVL
jgi:hypothetical protein